MAVSAGYKQTEVGVIPEDWEVKTLGEFISLRRGHDLTERERRQGEIPVIGSAGQNGFHDIALVKAPGVILGRSGASFGQAHFCEVDFWPHNTALYVTNFHDNNPRFVFYFLRSIDFSRHNSGGAQQSLNRNFIAPILVAIPPLAEQQAIAEALRDVDGLISGVDALIAKKRLIKQGAMQELLTGQRRLPGFAGAWAVKELVNISTISSGTTPSRDLGERYYSNGTINWVKTTDLNNSDIVETSEKVTEIAIKETNLKIYDVGTVLVAMYGGFNQIGRTGLLKIPAAVNQALTAIRPESKALDSVFLINYLNFQVGYWKNVAMSSRKDPNITSADIKNFPIALPPLSEQIAIAQILADMDAEIAALGQKRAKTVALKQGMMQSLLTGAVRLG